MATREPFQIDGTTIAPGEARDLHVSFSESYLGSPVHVPVRVIHAEEEGPKVFITGAIHGDELGGIGVIRELLYEHAPEVRRGTLILVPVVNVYGLENHSRYLPDRRDLNRCFPGSSTGSMSSRLAHKLYHEIVKRCDFGIDFHAAAVRRTNYPNVRADMRHPLVKKIARSFGCELIVDGRGPDGSLRATAVKHGVPVIILEAGEVWKTESSVVEIGVRGCMNVLSGLGMVEYKSEPPIFQVVVKKTTWVRAERGGALGFHARPGDIVAEGHYLATNYNIFGRERRALVSPVKGIVLGMSTMPVVKPGEPVYHIAELSDATYRRIRRLIEKSSDESLFNRIQDHLSGSINIQERELDGI